MGEKGTISIRDIYICFVLHKYLKASRVRQYLQQIYYSKGFKAIYLTFLKCNIYTSKKQRKETCTEQTIGRFLEHSIIA